MPLLTINSQYCSQEWCFKNRHQIMSLLSSNPPVVSFLEKKPKSLHRPLMPYMINPSHLSELISYFSSITPSPPATLPWMLFLEHAKHIPDLGLYTYFSSMEYFTFTNVLHGLFLHSLQISDQMHLTHEVFPDHPI